MKNKFFEDYDISGVISFILILLSVYTLSVNARAGDIVAGMSLLSKNIDSVFNEKPDLLIVKYYYKSNTFVDAVTYKNAFDDRMIGARWGYDYHVSRGFFVGAEMGIDYGYEDEATYCKYGYGSKRTAYRPKKYRCETQKSDLIYDKYGIAGSLSLGYMFKKSFDFQAALSNRRIMLVVNYKIPKHL
jgi:hypothetical protein